MTAIWSDEARAVVAEDRRRENYELELWDEGRRGAFDDEISEVDGQLEAEAQALFEWSQGMRP